MKFDSKDLISSLILLGLLFIFNSEVVFFQKYFALGHFQGFLLPYFIAEQIHNGTVPLWMPVPDLGKPIFSQLGAGVFYPFNCFFLIPDFLGVFRDIILGHFYMAAWFMYLWLRRLDVRHLAALIGAIIFAYSATLISWHQNPQYLEACVWLPLAALLFHYATKRGDSRLAIIGGLILAIQLLSGAIFFFAGTIIFLLIWSWLAYREPGLTRLALRNLAIGLGICFFAVLYVLLPFFELWWARHGLTFRVTPSFAGVSGQNEVIPLALEHVLGVVLPPWHDFAQLSVGTYAGISALFLALCAVFLKAGAVYEAEINAFFSALGVSLIGLTIGFLPGARTGFDFQVVMFFLVFALASLATCGFDRLLSVCEDWEEPGRAQAVKRFQIVLWSIFGFTVVLWSLLILALSHKGAFINNLVSRGWVLPSAQDPQPFREVLDRFLHSMLFSLALASAAPLLLLKRLRIQGEEKFFAALVLVVVTWELFQVNSDMLQLNGKPELRAKIATALQIGESQSRLIVTDNLAHLIVAKDRLHGLAVPEELLQGNAMEETGWQAAPAHYPNVWDFEVEARRPGIFVLKQSFAPGWHAYVDGIERETLKINDKWVGTLTDGGKRHVKFMYRPLSFVMGKYLTFAFLTGLVIFLLHPFSFKTLIRTFSLAGLRRD